MINILATLRINIQAFGLIKGLRLPIFIYGAIKTKNIGNIHIHCPIQRRLIVIGTNHDTVAAPYTIFNNTGTVEVYGKVFLNYGTTFMNKGLVIFRGNDLIGNMSNIDVHERLYIGSNTSIGAETHISDTDHHYVIDVKTHKVPKNFAPVIIGNFNWFGSNSYIKKGTVTPDYLIVASPFSMLSKDYTSLPPYSVVAGCPARVVKQGIRRLYNFKEERNIQHFFRQNPEIDFYQLNEDANLDDICKLS